MNKRFEALDAFRGLCAISVVIFHMHLVGSITELGFFRGSSIFVEFFFVLSGFVLAHGYGFKDNLEFKPFLKSRIFRIFPLHATMLLVMIILEFGKLFAYKYAGFTFNNPPFTGPGAISEIIPNLLLIQSWTPFTEPLTFNYPSWSISIEFYMYIFLFFSIVTFKKAKVLSWIITSLIMLYLLTIQSDLLQSEVLRGLSCFFGGAFTYTVFRKIGHVKIKTWLGTIIEISLLLFVIYIVDSDFKYRTTIAICTFFVVVGFFAFESGLISSLLKRKPFQVVGRLSYSIYMIHAAFLFCLISLMMILQKVTGLEVAPIIDGKRALTSGSEILNNGIVIFIIVLVIATAYYTHKFIEVKGQNLGKMLNSNNTRYMYFKKKAKDS